MFDFSMLEELEQALIDGATLVDLNDLIGEEEVVEEPAEEPAKPVYVGVTWAQASAKAKKLAKDFPEAFAFDARLGKAVKIASSGRIIKVNESTYRVPSQSEPNKWYTVTTSGKRYTCDCPDRAARCKHNTAVYLVVCN